MSVVVQVLHLVKIDAQHLQPALSWSQGHFSHMCWLCKNWCYVLLLCIDVHVFIMCWHRTTVGVSWMLGISTHTNSLYLYVWLPWFRARLVAHGWNRGHAISISLSLYLYITCMYRYIRILILTIIYSYICTYLYVKKTHYKKIVAVFLFLLFFYCFSPWFMVCRGFKTPLGSPLGSKTQSAYSLNCVPTGTTCTLPGRHRRPGWPSWKPSIGWTANSINAWILFIDQWKIKTMKIHGNRIYWNTHIWCIFLKMDSTEINISLIGLLEKNIGIIFHHWVSISEMDD